MAVGLGLYSSFYGNAISRIVWLVINAARCKCGFEGGGAAVVTGLSGGESLMGVVIAFMVMFSSL